MNQRHIIFVPGKNPKPPPDQHQSLLWRTLLEGVCRAEPGIFDDLGPHAEDFKLIAWNHLYYHKSKDISRDLPWIDALFISMRQPHRIFRKPTPGTANWTAFCTAL
jgi:hypothetical protein